MTIIYDPPLTPEMEAELARQDAIDAAILQEVAEKTNTVPYSADELLAPELPVTPEIQLTAAQARAVEVAQALSKQREPGLAIIAGYAGTGKTTTLRAIVRAVGDAIVITPTGKAALRVKEATGLDAMTIHRWMFKPVEDRETGAIRFVPREMDEIDLPRSRIVLLDEASMVGAEVWNELYRACRYLDLHVICVGDGFQLPPVVPPKTPPFSLLDPAFAEQQRAPRVELTEILRQAQDSPIIRASMALREGDGVRAFYELPRPSLQQVGSVCVETYKAGGVVICHRNVTRHRINAGMRGMLGIHDEQPQPGEPLLVLKNTYEVGLYNGETTPFGGWTRELTTERIYDRYKKQEEHGRFGGTAVNEVSPVVMCLDEMHGRLQSPLKPIMIAGQQHARANNVLLGAKLAPHVHTNFGYCYTAHKSQGSQWPYALVVLEPSVRLNEEEGRRWAYTAITRAATGVAVYIGNIN